MDDKESGQEPRHLGKGGRPERDHDIITFVLAGVLALIVLAAVGYGISNSSRVATILPLPKHRSDIATKGTAPTATDGSNTAHPKSSGHR
jgi:hypothetical protein